MDTTLMLILSIVGVLVAHVAGMWFGSSVSSHTDDDAVTPPWHLRCQYCGVAAPIASKCNNCGGPLL